VPLRVELRACAPELSGSAASPSDCADVEVVLMGMAATYVGLADPSEEAARCMRWFVKITHPAMEAAIVSMRAKNLRAVKSRIPRKEYPEMGDL
jgi:hypothetical protein